MAATAATFTSMRTAKNAGALTADGSLLQDRLARQRPSVGHSGVVG